MLQLPGLWALYLLSAPGTNLLRRGLTAGHNPWVGGHIKPCELAPGHQPPSSLRNQMTSSTTKSALIKIILGLLIAGLIADQLSEWVIPARAASGLPNSAEFGYGARLDVWGQEVELAINAASSVGVDWIGVDFDWQRHWPDAAAPVNLEPLDRVMAIAQSQGINVLLSLTHAPTWALGADGPDIGQTSALVTMLANRYPQSLLTIELFPTANTSAGWGVPPDPGAYVALFQACQAILQTTGSQVLLVAGGLSPLGQSPSVGDMDDLDFLNGLYKAGAANFMSILSLRLSPAEGEAMTPPGETASRVLRHYETVRQVMLQFNHANGLIWITGFSWPVQSKVTSPEGQIRWLNQAFQLMKSQLYIGVAFFDRLNPPEGGKQTASPIQSLIQKDAKGTHLHPALAALGQIITLNQTGYSSFQIFLYKKITAGPAKRLWKHR